MVTHNSTKSFGYILKRADVLSVSVMKFKQELLYNLFEANIIKATIQAFQDKKLSNFDCMVGDWKCQTRTSMIMDLISNAEAINNQLKHDLIQINSLIIKNEKLFQEIDNYTSMECQRLTKQLHEISLSTSLKQYNLNYTPSPTTIFLSLCFLTTPENTLSNFFIKYHISTHKQKAIINQAKQELCYLSINYAQELAQQYGTTEEQQALQQIEIKNIQHMTSLFVEFRCIFKKMQVTQQPFIIRQTFFCNCGKVQSLQNSFYAVKNNRFQETNLPSTKDQAITTIDAYQYPGSLPQLQDLLAIPRTAQGIPKEYYKPCQCLHPTPKKSIKSIDEAIMAFFAQHPQFTNNQSIDFARFGLLDSDLKKEYDYLLTLPGFSRQNMSIFHINHMYPSTIADVLTETTQLNNAMNQHVNKRIMQPSCTISTQLN